MRMSLALGLMLLASPTIEAMGEVPADLQAAVRFQQENKNAFIKKLQQHAASLRQQGNVTGAKEMKASADAVRTDELLILPPLGEASADIGTLRIEKILETTNDGIEVETSLPRLENTSVNVETGRRGTSPFGMGFVYHPARIHVATPNAIRDGQSINVRRTANGFEEITPEEMAQAAKLLKRK